MIFIEPIYPLLSHVAKHSVLCDCKKWADPIFDISYEDYANYNYLNQKHDIGKRKLGGVC